MFFLLKNVLLLQKYHDYDLESCYILYMLSYQRMQNTNQQFEKKVLARRKEAIFSKLIWLTYHIYINFISIHLSISLVPARSTKIG